MGPPFNLRERRNIMDKRKLKNVVKTGIKLLGGIGAAKIVYNITPGYRSICCNILHAVEVMRI